MRLFNDVLFFFLDWLEWLIFLKCTNWGMNDKQIKNQIKENKLVKNLNPLI